jgi:uncharacterized protein
LTQAFVFIIINFDNNKNTERIYMHKPSAKSFLRLTLAALSGLVLAYGAFSMSSFASDMPRTQSNIYVDVSTGRLSGTLELPEATQALPVVLLIAGSGPTDRDGNQVMMKNNALKHVALGLKAKGIASVRYDKRGIGESKAAATSEQEMRFDHLVSDAEAWIKYLQADSRFNRVVVLGHSEGSLIGMIAAQHTQTQGFISVAGAGLPAAQIIDRQLQAQSPALAQKAAEPLAQLVQGHTINKYPMALNSLFRSSVQPYLISWFKYDPRKEIAKLQQPVLIVQGNHDLQVEVSDAEALFEAQPHAQKQVLEGMNHVLKTAPMEKLGNLKTYAQPDLPLHPSLIPVLVDFIGSTGQGSVENKVD